MRLAILHDHDCWAQAMFSHGLKTYAPKGLDVSRQLVGEFVYSREEAVLCINFASVRRYGSAHVSTCVASHGWLHRAYSRNNWRTRGVSPRRNLMEAKKHLLHADAVICRNQALTDCMGQFHRNVKCFPAGVDTAIFSPGKPRNERLRIGWCGQVNPGMDGHFKGYYEVWLKLKERLGYKYEFVENTRTANEALGWHDLADWFRTLDVFLTTATAEGTPNPPFQAAACGAVVVSTDVGQVSDWVDLRSMDLIVPDYGNEAEAERTIQEFTRRLEILEDPHVRHECRERILASIERHYDYRVLAPRILEFLI